MITENEVGCLYIDIKKKNPNTDCITECSSLKNIFKIIKKNRKRLFNQEQLSLY